VASKPGLILEASRGFREQMFQLQIRKGNRVSFGYDCHVGCIDTVALSEDALIASRVFMSDHGHGNAYGLTLALQPAHRPQVSKSPVHAGSHVSIGEGVCILSGETIGDNVAFGANWVVTRNVPPDAVFAGASARH
jgi:acetyltransferase-like isoleucine patch superfamily enzyme